MRNKLIKLFKVFQHYDDHPISLNFFLVYRDIKLQETSFIYIIIFFFCLRDVKKVKTLNRIYNYWIYYWIKRRRNN